MNNARMLFLALMIIGSWGTASADSAPSFTDANLARTISIVGKVTDSSIRAEAGFWIDESRAAIKDGKSLLARTYAERAEKIAGGGSARALSR
ncbi:hypothetical protein GGE65_007362 [Skermanella aerolata]|uniref:hypothetical protein n=1 Tax=Skermanella aerolata TaxID=393310 RepID=UPI003D22AE72